MIHYELVFVVVSDLLFRILLLESNSFPISIILKQENRFFFFFKQNKKCETYLSLHVFGAMLLILEAL